MYDIVSIGSTTFDSFWKTDFDTVDFDKSPSKKAIAIPYGEKFGIEDVIFSLGGNAANTSVTFARQGLKTSLLTKIGNDSKGEQIRKWIVSNNISVKNIYVSDKFETAESVILLQKGERSILTYHGVLNDFSFDNVKLNKLRAKWWYVSLPGDSYKFFGKLLEFANRKNIRIALNPSGHQLYGEGKKYLIEHLASVSILIVNEEEASMITEVPIDRKDEIFRKLDDMVDGIAVVTKGKDGVEVSDGRKIYVSGIFENVRVIDRTGAGDAFGSGFVSGIIKNGGEINEDNIKYGIRIGSANSTSVIKKIGATAGILYETDFSDEQLESLDINIINI